MFIFFDPTFWIFMVPAMLIGIWAQIKVTTAYHKYKQVRVARGLTGYDAARAILNANGLYDVRIEKIAGEMTDHFDPRANVVRLSADVYDKASVASVGIAAHECGHAVQYAKGYTPMKIRGALVGATNFSSLFSMMFVILGVVFANPLLAYFGVGLFAVVALFQLITLPVEFNASNRALEQMEAMGIVADDNEARGAKKVLSAAALTYVAALASAVATLIRIFAMRGRSRD